MSGHDAPERDELHTITLTELEAHVAAAGVLISRRQLMRHCEAGTFDAKRLPAVNNLEQWFIAPASVERGIADIKTLQEQRARRDASRPDMTNHVASKTSNHIVTDASGHGATRPDTSESKESADVPNRNPNAGGHDSSRPDVTGFDEEKATQTEPAVSQPHAQRATHPWPPFIHQKSHR